MNEYKFPSILKTLREKKGLTFRQLAKETGFSLAGVCRWEQGTQIPNIQTLVVFAKYFNVTTDYLVGLTNNEQN